MNRNSKHANRRFAVCLDDTDYEVVSLRKGNLYEVLPDAKASELGQIRVVDETREDYYYSADRFLMLNPRSLRKILKAMEPPALGRKATKRR